LSVAQQKTIAKALRDRLGREVNLKTEINENLIGGAVIRAGDVVIDGSLRSRLEGLANALIT
jgi:F-type H+-transporting ATPase subunit delta